VTVVIDASVIVKWLLQDPENEADTEKATQLLHAVTVGNHFAAQPVHWLAEVGAVLSRMSPETAANDIKMLCGLELLTVDDPFILLRGVQLATELKQHLFDTYYHAVALETPDAMLITADERYFRAARDAGRITLLADWS